MRAITPVTLGLASLSVAFAFVACGGTEPPPAPPPAASAPPPVVSAPPDAPSAVASAAPTAAPTVAPTAAPAAPPSPCPANMVLVQGGTYTMTRPKRDVTVGAICMDVNETTADEYAACVKTGKCNTSNLKCAPQATYEAPGKGNHPINCVDMAQAVTYCTAQNKRLASDEEWEWVARGGAANNPYPWGKDKPNGKACWSGENPLVSTCAVGATPAGDNPQGIHDLAGNVFEWVTTKADKAGAFRVGRGGAWNDASPDGLKVTRTGPGFLVTYRCGFLGIRCVVEPAKP